MNARSNNPRLNSQYTLYDKRGPPKKGPTICNYIFETLNNNVEFMINLLIKLIVYPAICSWPIN